MGWGPRRATASTWKLPYMDSRAVLQRFQATSGDQNAARHLRGLPPALHGARYPRAPEQMIGR